MKKLIKILPVVMVLCIVVTSVFAANAGIDVPSTDLSGGLSIGTADVAVKKVWGTVMTIVQILAVAAVVFAGLRYMFASADQKADIKKSMGILVVGAILVFGATLVLNFVTGLAGQVLGEK